MDSCDESLYTLINTYNIEYNHITIQFKQIDQNYTVYNFCKHFEEFLHFYLVKYLLNLSV